MMGSFLTRAFVLVLGYAYPAYECYKTVELNRPEIEQLRFWCQYWILVALLTVFERVGDTFISWLPMYSEAKLAFFVYLWYPKTRGTTYVYDTFFRPYIAKHETEIDRNLLELRTRAGDIVVCYWQRAASYGQTRFFEILQYVASQSQAQSQSSRPRPVQSQQIHQKAVAAAAAAPARQTAASQQAQQQQQQPTRSPPSPNKSQQLQESTKLVAPSPADPVALPRTSSTASPPSIEAARQAVPTEGEMQIDAVNVPPAKEDANPPPIETPMEEAIRVTRGSLRKRAAVGGPIH